MPLTPEVKQLLHGLASAKAGLERAAQEISTGQADLTVRLSNIEVKVDALVLDDARRSERDKHVLGRFEERIDDHEDRLRGIERLVWKAAGAGVAGGAGGAGIVYAILKASGIV